MTIPTRRQFLRTLTAAAIAHKLPAQTQHQHDHMQMPTPSAAASGTVQQMPPMLRSSDVKPWVDPLPLPQKLHGNKLRITMREIHASVHRDLAPSRLWSYGDTALAPLIDTRVNHPLQVEWVNNLPTKHFFPVDYSLHGCGHDIPDVRANVHLHGGRTPSKDDGQPEDWYLPGQSRTCTYPLQQEATALWYHDHAMGLNRLNIYAGLFGMVLLRDDIEDALHLPSGKYEIPLMIYDRMITRDGQIFYPDSGDPEHPWVSEFGGDSILVNGKLFPFLEVEPRLYRIRLLNCANSAFFNLALTANQPFHQIGSDQGLLAAPVEHKQLLIAPSERADLLIDFSRSAGQTIHLTTNSRNILQFRVANTGYPEVSTSSLLPHGYPEVSTSGLMVHKEGGALAPASIPTTLRPITRTPESAATVTRTITLDEYDNQHGDSMLMMLDGKHWHEPVTEKPKLNSTEIWEFVNLTEDTHPMHLHLVRFQILDRRVFDTLEFHRTRKLRYISGSLAPEAHELGWKDVAQCPPTMVTRIIVNFNGYTGKYLYHCHILEHESNDMMRPFEVIA